MKSLKENSINVTGSVVVCWPQFGTEETIDMTDIGSKCNGAFCTNNSTLIYVIDHEVFVTPYTRGAMSAIVDAGLVKKYFYVPFSNLDYPKYEKAKWDKLLQFAKESAYHFYDIDCAKWCDDHDIGKLSEETLERCFKMPRSGVPVRHLYFEDTYYPVCSESYIDCTVVDKLGTYCTNNGKVVFVYHDGHTYVAKGYWILDELRSAGYRESGLFVPFSNGEQITDSALAAKWAQVASKK